MEVVEACSSLMSNREVLEMIRSHNNHNKKPTNLATIIYETTSYLESTPAANYSLTNLSDLLDAIKERNYELSKVEKVQLADLKPQNETELHLILNDIEKFTEEQRSDIIQLVQLNLDKSSEVISKKIKTE